MSDHDIPPGGTAGDGRPNVSEVIEVAEGEGFAFVPGEVLVRANSASRLLELTGQAAEFVAEREEDRQGRGWQLAQNVDDPVGVAAALLAEGHEAQPNHVVFVHNAECPPHPAVVLALVGTGALPAALETAALAALEANPMGANPMGANPMGANPMQNTAVPVAAPTFPARILEGDGPRPTIVVLDTGVARQHRQSEPAVADHSPPLFVQAAAAGPPDRIDGALDLPDVDIPLKTGNTAAADDFLDPAAGHGTFIAGIVEQLAPGCRIVVRRVIGPLGSADEKKVANEIHDVVDEVEAGDLPRPVILSLSFGGRALAEPDFLLEAVERAIAADIQIIASAGNDGVCLPQYPAAFPDVIAVGALGPGGPPPWTNYGDWVTACAPGVDLVSSFFDNWNGAFPTDNGADPDHFSGWAKWSGTSFSVPVVVAAVARELVGGPAVDSTKTPDALLAAAVDRVVRAPHLARLPLLGTVVNI